MLGFDLSRECVEEAKRLHKDVSGVTFELCDALVDRRRLLESVREAKVSEGSPAEGCSIVSLDIGGSRAIDTLAVLIPSLFRSNPAKRLLVIVKCEELFDAAVRELNQVHKASAAGATAGAGTENIATVDAAASIATRSAATASEALGSAAAAAAAGEAGEDANGASAGVGKKRKRLPPVLENAAAAELTVDWFSRIEKEALGRISGKGGKGMKGALVGTGIKQSTHNGINGWDIYDQKIRDTGNMYCV